MKLQKWTEAQEHEKRFWLGLDRQNLKMSLARFSKILSLVDLKEFKNKRLLDVGSGPKGGILTVLPRTELKVAADPLMNRNLIGTTSDIEPLLTTAEKLPIQDDSFDIVFCVNALDHMADPHKALYEIFRVTRKIFVLMVHVVSPKRKALHAIFHSTYIAKTVLSHLLETPKPLSHVVYGSFLFLSILFADSIRRIIQDGYAHPHYLSSLEIINTLAKTGFSIRKLKAIPDISYGTFKLNLCIIAGK